MDESYLPWWLILLIGMWAAALTVWQHPAVHREVRLWAGLLTLVYLGLFFLALGSIPRSETVSNDHQPPANLVKIGFAACVILSLTMSVWFVGRVSTASRQFSYVVLTLANSAAAFLLHAHEVAAGLVLVAVLSAWPAVRKWRRSRPVSTRREWLSGIIQFHEEAVPRDKSGIVWLQGCLNGVLACLLLGTIAFSVRFEASRTAASTRLTALPARMLLEQFHEKSARKVDLLSSLVGTRSEIIVLLAVILFLCLAITSGRESEEKNSPLEISVHSRSDSISEQKAGGLV